MQLCMATICAQSAETRRWFSQAVENAIREGIIYWHAFPYNGQLELMDERHVRESVQLTHALDEKYGYKPKITLSQVCIACTACVLVQQCPTAALRLCQVLLSHGRMCDVGPRTDTGACLRCILRESWGRSCLLCASEEGCLFCCRGMCLA